MGLLYQRTGPICRSLTTKNSIPEEMQKTLKLIVLDVDGVLSKGEAAAFDLSLFQRLADFNRRARREESLPAITLNTGRPSAYVEAVMQAIGGWQPALYESGAGLYLPQSYHFQTSPRLTAVQIETLQEIVQRLDQKVVRPGRAYWQPGKMVCHTIFAQPPLTSNDVMPEVKAIVREISDYLGSLTEYEIEVGGQSLAVTDTDPRHAVVYPPEHEVGLKVLEDCLYILPEDQ